MLGFNRVESLKNVITKKTMDVDTISVIVDLHFAKSNVTEEEYNMLMGMLFPEEVTPE